MSRSLLNLFTPDPAEPPGRARAFYLISAAGLGSLMMLVLIMIYATLTTLHSIGADGGLAAVGLVMRLGALSATLVAMFYLRGWLKRSVARLDAMAA